MIANVLMAILIGFEQSTPAVSGADFQVLNSEPSNYTWVNAAAGLDLGVPTGGLRYRIGGPMNVTVALRNTSQAPVNFYLDSSDYEFSLKSADGRAIARRTDMFVGTQGRAGDEPTLGPGGAYLRTFDLSNYFKIERAGHYRATVTLFIGNAERSMERAHQSASFDVDLF
jgi:hypothetical protein